MPNIVVRWKLPSITRTLLAASRPSNDICGFIVFIQVGNKLNFQSIKNPSIRDMKRRMKNDVCKIRLAVMQIKGRTLFLTLATTVRFQCSSVKEVGSAVFLSAKTANICHIMWECHVQEELVICLNMLWSFLCWCTDRFALVFTDSCCCSHVINQYPVSFLHVKMKCGCFHSCFQLPLHLPEDGADYFCSKEWSTIFSAQAGVFSETEIFCEYCPEMLKGRPVVLGTKQWCNDPAWKHTGLIHRRINSLIYAVIQWEKLNDKDIN